MPLFAGLKGEGYFLLGAYTLSGVSHAPVCLWILLGGRFTRVHCIVGLSQTCGLMSCWLVEGTNNDRKPMDIGKYASCEAKSGGYLLLGARALSGVWHAPVHLWILLGAHVAAVVVEHEISVQYLAVGFNWNIWILYDWLSQYIYSIPIEEIA